MDDLIKIGGKSYYFDLDALFESIRLRYTDYDIVEPAEISGDTKDEIESFSYQNAAFNGPKYETLRSLIEIFFNEMDIENEDTAMGMDFILENKTNLYFNIAYNTLIKNGILKTIDYGE